jgi:hypothetical protein
MKRSWISFKTDWWLWAIINAIRGAMILKKVQKNPTFKCLSVIGKQSNWLTKLTYFPFMKIKKKKSKRILTSSPWVKLNQKECKCRPWAVLARINLTGFIKRLSFQFFIKQKRNSLNSPTKMKKQQLRSVIQIKAYWREFITEWYQLIKMCKSQLDLYKEADRKSLKTLNTTKPWLKKKFSKKS